ncbi:MAG: putative toxin-antitoxin system toxin component, PIN family [Pseudomonadota bacterium]|nr:putative toxin-antitoxin system toxin component, PIN family [Pseudomonadota bacterium]
MTPLCVVLDTNVLLSALLFRSNAMAWIRHAWQSGGLVPLVGRETVGELIRVLAYPKFALTADERTELLADYLPWCETVSVPLTTVVPECRDPNDRPFLALALVGEADALVSGDADLLSLAPTFAVPILSPADFRVFWEAAGDNRTG